MSKRSADEFQAWMQGKPPALVAFAMGAVTSADELVDLMRSLRAPEGLPPKLPSPPDVSIWLALYRDHRRLYNCLGGLVGLSAEDHGDAMDWLDGMRELDRPDKAALLLESLNDDPHAVADAMDTLRNDFNAALIEEFTDNVSTDLADDAAMRSMVGTPEYQFLLRVWMPCRIEYRTYPGLLLRRARLGEIDALEKLLRLDKAVIHDPRIANEIHQAFHTRGRKRFDRLAKAISGRVLGQTSKAKVKRGLAGMIGDFAQRIKHPLTEPDIRRLFDIVARQRGHLRDQHLPARSETLAQSMRRDRGTFE